MTRPLNARLGFAGGTQVTTIEQVARESAWAESAGFDSYWLSFVSGVDPLVAFAAAAPATQTIELGTSVVPMAGRHAIALGQLARTTQQACAGRFTLGIGPSHQIVVEGAYGETWSKPVERTSEYLDALVSLCNGEAAAVEGTQVRAQAELAIPAEPVPVVLAALGPRMLELAGTKTAGTHVGQTGPRTLREHTVPLINAAAAAAGRAAPRIIALVNLCVGEPSVIRAAAAPGMAVYGALPSYQSMHDREGLSDPTELILAGSMQEIAQGLAAYVDAGATDLRIGIAAPDSNHRQATLDALAEWMT